MRKHKPVDSISLAQITPEHLRAVADSAAKVAETIPRLMNACRDLRLALVRDQK